MKFWENEIDEWRRNNGYTKPDDTWEIYLETKLIYYLGFLTNFKWDWDGGSQIYHFEKDSIKKFVEFEWGLIRLAFSGVKEYFIKIYKEQKRDIVAII